MKDVKITWGEIAKVYAPQLVGKDTRRIKRRLQKKLAKKQDKKEAVIRYVAERVSRQMREQMERNKFESQHPQRSAE